MRKIIGNFQISIFFLFGFWLINFKFQKATSHTDTYWVAGLIYILLGILLWKLVTRYSWFVDAVSDKAAGNGGSKFTIPFVFIIGLVSILQSKDRLLNIDSIMSFIILIAPLASILGYVGYLAQSSMRPSQFKGSMYKKLLVPLLYLGSFMLAFSLLTSANYKLPSEYNENRVFDIVKADCNSEYITVKTIDGERKFYYPNRTNSQQEDCADATAVIFKLQMNVLGIDYFDEFEFLNNF